MADASAGEGKPLFRVAGIPVFIPPSGLLGVGLIAYLWSAAFSGYSLVTQAAMAIAFALLLYLSIFAHEMAHASAAKKFGYPVQRVVLWILGGFTVYEPRGASPRREALIAVSGPAATFAIGAGFWVLQDVLPPGPIGEMAFALAFANLLMAAYNMLPGIPLDGGSLLKAGVWGVTGSEQRGTIAAAWGGRILAALVLALPFALALPEGKPSLWNVAVASIFSVMLWSSSTSALRRTMLERRSETLRVGDLTRRAIPVDGALPLSEAVARCHSAGATAMVVVDAAGAPLGIVSSAAVEATPPARRPWVTAASASRRIGAHETLPRDLSGMDLIRALALHPASDYLVVDDNGLVFGVLTTADVEARLAGR